VLEEWRPALSSAQERELIRGDLAVDELSEWILRSILSLLIVEGPEHHSTDDERRLIATFLVPAVIAT